MSANSLAAAIRAKDLSPAELLRAVYARLHGVNDRINAFCTLTEEIAVRAAREAESAVMRGDALGALHGIPFSVKDLLQSEFRRLPGLLPPRAAFSSGTWLSWVRDPNIVRTPRVKRLPIVR
jgi:hypothetical protein